MNIGDHRCIPAGTEAKRAVIPVFQATRSHWTVAVAELESDDGTGTILLYDSLPNKAGGGVRLEPQLRKRLLDIASAVFKSQTHILWNLRRADGPMQRDGHSCGPFTIAWVAHYLRLIPTMHRPADALYIRAWVINLLLRSANNIEEWVPE